MSSLTRIRKAIGLSLLLLVVAALVIVQIYLHLDDDNPVANRISEKIADLERKNYDPAPAHIKWDDMDYGPFFSSSLGGGRNPVAKGVSVKIGDTNEAAICFDTELLRVRSGWTDAFLKLPRRRGGLDDEPAAGGPEVFETFAQPGWSLSGDFSDPRTKIRNYHYGRLPEQLGHYHGLYRYGQRTVFSYRIGTNEILESPWFQRSAGVPVFSRTFQITGHAQSMMLHLCNATNATLGFADGFPTLLSHDYKHPVLIAANVVGAPKGFQWKKDTTNAIQLELPPFTGKVTFSVFISSVTNTNATAALAALPRQAIALDFDSALRGGPSLWKETVVTRGKSGTQKGAYQLDFISLPEENPWKSWLRPSGFDFFPDGRAAICSLSGDVWIVSGINRTLENVQWKRYATGLFQPLGLKVVDEEIFVICRDGLVRLRDLNKDGEADFYENFQGEIANSRNFHEFCMDLQTDAKGNFYTFKGSNLGSAITPDEGTLLRISRDGSTLQAIANGFRAPNGLCITPSNEIFGSDNEGTWIPASKLNRIRENRFYGFVPASHQNSMPTNFESPIFWLPRTVDNSSGAPVWVNSERWGPLNNHLLHTSYGKCSLFAVLSEEVQGVMQGGVVKLPLPFDSGIMRARFNPVDGQLYLCGLLGWETSATKDGGFYRVRYTGKPANLPCALHVRAGEIEIGFTDALDEATARDPQNFSVEQWNYQWSEEYGSKEFRTKASHEVGHDTLEIESVNLSADRKRISLRIAGLKPVMQMKIKYNLDAADGSSLQQEIYNTINVIPPKTDSTQGAASLSAQAPK